MTWSEIFFLAGAIVFGLGLVLELSNRVQGQQWLVCFGGTGLISLGLLAATW